MEDIGGNFMAEALAEGLSLDGAGEALSIGAAGLFLRSLTGNPMDVHLHTSANLRRYLLRLDGVTPGDLALVARKARTLDESDVIRIAQWVADEVAAKPGSQLTRIGF